MYNIVGSNSRCSRIAKEERVLWLTFKEKAGSNCSRGKDDVEFEEMTSYQRGKCLRHGIRPIKLMKKSPKLCCWELDGRHQKMI